MVDCSHLMITGSVGSEVVFEWREEMAKDRHTPRLPEQSLPARPSQVSHVSVVVWESKQPTEKHEYQ